jgi:site-specific recombinase XerD
MFFVRLDEWAWDEAPPRVPMFPGDLPRQDHPLPKALDDASAAKLLRAAQNDKRLLVRVTVEMLLRTGLRVSEYTSLRAGAVVQIGAGPWLHVPVGKLREDRYLPLHPHLVALIDDYRTRHVAPGNPLLLPRENGKPADRHAVTRYINKAAAAAGLPHIHPHQLRHSLAAQAINRGMSLEAIAAMPGHYAGDLVKLIMLGDCLVEAGQQSVEDFLAPGLALGGGVVALLFEGGTELDGGLEERA